MQDILKDVSTITTIPLATLKSLSEKEIWCIVSNFCNNIKIGENLSELDLGIGILQLYYDKDQIRYKFIPSSKLEEALISSAQNHTNPLELMLEKSLITKIMNIYKDII